MKKAFLVVLAAIITLALGLLSVEAMTVRKAKSLETGVDGQYYIKLPSPQEIISESDSAVISNTRESSYSTECVGSDGNQVKVKYSSTSYYVEVEVPMNFWNMNEIGFSARHYEYDEEYYVPDQKLEDYYSSIDVKKDPLMGTVLIYVANNDCYQEYPSSYYNEAGALICNERSEEMHCYTDMIVGGDALLTVGTYKKTTLLRKR